MGIDSREQRSKQGKDEERTHDARREIQALMENVKHRESNVYHPTLARPTYWRVDMSHEEENTAPQQPSYEIRLFGAHRFDGQRSESRLSKQDDLCDHTKIHKHILRQQVELISYRGRSDGLFSTFPESLYPVEHGE